jgi:hypothetical protein
MPGEMAGSLNTEALLEAIEMGFDRHFAADLYVPQARAALDAIASELPELPGLWQAVKESARRAEAAEAELERVRAERDEGEIRWNAAEQRVAGLITALSAQKARLDRAVEALRQIGEEEHPRVAVNFSAAIRIARAALAEIDWPDGDEVGQPTC